VTVRRWLADIALFFVWGFVVHAVGLLLHELGGHALVAWVFACGVRGIDLTLFGHGQVFYARCDDWTPGTILLADWSGLAVTIAAGLVAACLSWPARRASLGPLRLLLVLGAYLFLLGQLGYATSGGFHDLYDPGRAARWLGARGAHAVAWVPPLAAYTAAAFLGARALVDAFREHAGADSRGRTVVRLASTLGLASVLYYAAFRVEQALRVDVRMQGVAVEARRVAAARHAPEPFPIDLVLAAIVVVALGAALGRRSTARPTPAELPHRLVLGVAAAAAACLAVLAASSASG